MTPPERGSQWMDLRFPQNTLTVEGIIAPNPDDTQYPSGCGKAYSRDSDSGRLLLIDLREFGPEGPLTPLHERQENAA